MLDSLPVAALPYPAYKTQVSAVGRISATGAYTEYVRIASTARD